MATTADAATDPRDAAVTMTDQTLQDLKQTLTCRICVHPMYQPFTISCGHTFCYGCLYHWFKTNNRRKTCPACRHNVETEPAPSFAIRELVTIFTNRSASLLLDENPDENEAHSVEEARLIEEHRAKSEMFGGMFKRRKGRRFRANEFLSATGIQLQPIRDVSDGVDRCPNCTWELQNGFCEHCDTWISGGNEGSFSEGPISIHSSDDDSSGSSDSDASDEEGEDEDMDDGTSLDSTLDESIDENDNDMYSQFSIGEQGSQEAADIETLVLEHLHRHNQHHRTYGYFDEAESPSEGFQTGDYPEEYGENEDEMEEGLSSVGSFIDDEVLAGEEDSDSSVSGDSDVVEGLDQSDLEGLEQPSEQLGGHPTDFTLSPPQASRSRRRQIVISDDEDDEAASSQLQIHRSPPALIEISDSDDNNAEANPGEDDTFFTPPSRKRRRNLVEDSDSDEGKDDRAGAEGNSSASGSSRHSRSQRRRLSVGSDEQAGALSTDGGGESANAADGGEASDDSDEQSEPPVPSRSLARRRRAAGRSADPAPLESLAAESAATFSGAPTGARRRTPGAVRRGRLAAARAG